MRHLLQVRGSFLPSGPLSPGSESRPREKGKDPGIGKAKVFSPLLSGQAFKPYFGSSLSFSSAPRNGPSMMIASGQAAEAGENLYPNMGGDQGPEGQQVSL